MLADACCGEDDPFGIKLGQVVPGDGTLDLILEGVLEYRSAQLALAEKGELSPILQVEEVKQAVSVDAFGSSGVQQYAVDVGEVSGVLAEHGSGHDVPLS